MSFTKLVAELPEVALPNVDHLKEYASKCRAAGLPVSGKLKLEVERERVLLEFQRLEVPIYPNHLIERYQVEQQRIYLLKGKRVDWKVTPIENYMKRNTVPIRILNLIGHIKEHIDKDFRSPKFDILHMMPKEPVIKKVARMIAERRERLRLALEADPFLLMTCSSTGNYDRPIDVIAHWDEIDFKPFLSPQIAAPGDEIDRKLLEPPIEEPEVTEEPEPKKKRRVADHLRGDYFDVDY